MAIPTDDFNGNVRRIQGVDRTDLSSQLFTKMIGTEASNGFLGAKMTSGDMKWYCPEEGSAVFSTLKLTGMGASGSLYLDGAGNLYIGTDTGGEVTASDWLYSTDITATDPTTGYFKSDNADMTLSTKIFISKLDSHNDDKGAILTHLKVNDELFFRDILDENLYYFYEVTTVPVDHTTYFEIGVTFQQSGTGTFIQDQIVSTTLVYAGDIPTLQEVTNAGSVTPTVMTYNVHPTFGNDTEIVDKKYVDDAVASGGNPTLDDVVEENDTTDKIMKYDVPKTFVGDNEVVDKGYVDGKVDNLGLQEVTDNDPVTTNVIDTAGMTVNGNTKFGETPYDAALIWVETPDASHGTLSVMREDTLVLDVKANGAINAPDCEESNIVGDRDLITKEYFEDNQPNTGWHTIYDGAWINNTPNHGGKTFAFFKIPEAPYGGIYTYSAGGGTFLIEVIDRGVPSKPRKSSAVFSISVTPGKADSHFVIHWADEGTQGSSTRKLASFRLFYDNSNASTVNMGNAYFGVYNANGGYACDVIIKQLSNSNLHIHTADLVANLYSKYYQNGYAEYQAIGLQDAGKYMHLSSTIDGTTINHAHKNFMIMNRSAYTHTLHMAVDDSWLIGDFVDLFATDGHIIVDAIGNPNAEIKNNVELTPTTGVARIIYEGASKFRMMTSAPDEYQNLNRAGQIQVANPSNDLNDYKSRGFFYQNSDVSAGTGQNYPINESGSLDVKSWNSPDNDVSGVIQEYIGRVSKRMFIRSQASDNSWNAWTEIGAGGGGGNPSIGNKSINVSDGAGGWTNTPMTFLTPNNWLMPVGNDVTLTNDANNRWKCVDPIYDEDIVNKLYVDTHGGGSSLWDFTSGVLSPATDPNQLRLGGTFSTGKLDIHIDGSAFDSVELTGLEDASLALIDANGIYNKVNTSKYKHETRDYWIIDTGWYWVITNDEANAWNGAMAQGSGGRPTPVDGATYQGLNGYYGTILVDDSASGSGEAITTNGKIYASDVIKTSSSLQVGTDVAIGRSPADDILTIGIDGGGVLGGNALDIRLGLDSGASANLLSIKDSGVLQAPNCEVSDITLGTHLTTKDYVDSSSSTYTVKTLANLTGSLTADYDNGDYQRYTLTGNVTLEHPTNMEIGQQITFEFRQGGTGHTVTRGSTELVSAKPNSVHLVTVVKVTSTTYVFTPATEVVQ